MKRLLTRCAGLILALSLGAGLAACVQEDTTRSTAAPTPASATPTARAEDPDMSGIDNSAAEIGVMTQEYDGDNIAEILMIYYDGQQEALAEYGYKNPEIESLNNAVKFGVQQLYNSFIENADGESWIEIRSYPFTGEDYLQIVTTCATYPGYGTDGELYSYNFDLKANRFLSLYDALGELGLDEDSLAERAREKIAGLYGGEGTSAGEVLPAGFLLVDGPDGYAITLFLSVELLYDDADPWAAFFAYTPEWDEFYQLNSVCLFDPAEPDRMDPPLSYQTGQAYESALALSFDTAGLDELTPGYEYMLDGVAYFSIMDLMAPVAYAQEDVRAQIEALIGAPIELITITQSEEHSALLTYPVWLVVYQTGANEDTVHCADLYVQTDTADFWLHTSVPVDYELDYHDEIGARLGTVTLTD